MSWLFSRALMEDYANSPSSPGLVAEYSAANSSDGAPSAPSSSTHTPQAYLSPDKMTAFSRPFLFGMTFAPLPADRGEDVLTWFLAGFPVRTFPPPDVGPESTESAAGYGGKWHESLAKYDPATSSWKTHQFSLLGGLEPFSATFPRWGSMRNGECLARPMWARRTEGNGSGYLPTPLASLGTNGGPNQRDSSGRPGLQMAAQTWPTPTVCGNYNRKGASASSGDGLATAVRMLPTPTVNDAKNSTLPPSQVDHDNLPGYLLRNGVQTGGQLNPTWVEWLMGWPQGWTALDASETDRCHNAPPKLSGDCVNE